MTESTFEEMDSADLLGVGSMKGCISCGCQQLEEVVPFLYDFLGKKVVPGMVDESSYFIVIGVVHAEVGEGSCQEQA